MDPYLGEIKMFSYNWAPRGWLACNGDLLPIQQYAALYSLVGIQFGGNGTSTFAIPDLRGRTPMCRGTRAADGQVIQPGNKGGASVVTLTLDQIPAHSHGLFATTENASGKMVAGNYLAAAKIAGATGAAVPSYAASDTTKNVVLNTASISVAGASAAHNNMQPSLGLNFCIATLGVYPMRN